MGQTQVSTKQLKNDGILDEDLAPELRKRLIFVVRVATIVTGTLATSFQNGSTVDGVTLATNDLILIKDQTSGQENGVYTVNASGSPTRHPLYDSDTEIRPSTIQVKEGSNGGKLFRLTNTAAITVNTTSLVYAEFISTTSKAVDFTFESSLIDFTTTGITSLSVLPTGYSFYVESVFIIATDISGTLYTQPFVSIGHDIAPTLYLNNTQTAALYTAFRREVVNFANSVVTEEYLSNPRFFQINVITAATGSGLTFTGKLYIKGVLHKR